LMLLPLLRQQHQPLLASRLLDRSPLF